jgi:arylsulfatase A-like enzyme
VRWLAGRRGFRRVLGLYDSLGRRGAPEISRNFLRWVDANAGRPYFVFLNYLDAHSPYLPPPPFDRRFGYDVSAREPIVMEELNRVDDPGPEAAAIETAAYDGAIAYLDHEVGRMLRELDRRGTLANTIVVITSDHGEELGEHGAWGHGRSLHAQTVHVPLMLFGPAIPRGLRVTQPTSLRHVAATVGDLAGLDNASFGGQSLARYWSGPGNPPPDTVITELGTQRSVFLGNYHFIDKGGSEGPHLYDVIRDPTEQNDLIAQPVADSVTAPMMALVASFAARSGGGVERAIGRD